MLHLSLYLHALNKKEGMGYTMPCVTHMGVNSNYACYGLPPGACPLVGLILIVPH